MAGSPFSAVDDAVFAAHHGFTDLTALVAPVNIVQLDRPMDILERDALPDLGKQVLVSPADVTSTPYRYTGTDTKVLVNYDIVVRTGGRHLPTLRAIEYQTYRAAVTFCEGLQADGVTILGAISPWIYEKSEVSVLRQRQQPNGDNASSLESTIRITIALTAPIASILANASPAAPLPIYACYVAAANQIIVQFNGPIRMNSAAIRKEAFFANVGGNPSASALSAIPVGNTVVLAFAAFVGTLRGGDIIQFDNDPDLQPGIYGANGTDVDSFVYPITELF